MRSTARTLITLAAAGLLAACSPAPAPDADLADRLVADVTGAGAYPHLEALQRIADENGGNRAVGTPGYDASVEYVTGVLRVAGYDVQTPPVEVRTFSVQDQRLTVNGEPFEARALTYSPPTPAAGLSGPLAVIGQHDTSGCEAGDFAGVPAGAIALVRRGACPFSRKARLAGAAGAAAVVVVNTEGGPLHGTLGEAASGTVPVAGVSSSVGTTLAGRAGARTALLLATTTAQTATRNVIAQTRTGGTAHVVMAGAHLDSVPAGPGINDNGSGAAALLEIATRLGGSPATTNAVRFAWWGAEEIGLVGSRSYLTRLTEADRRRIAAYVNLDMVASPNAAYLVHDGDDSEHRGAGPGPAGSGAVERVLTEQLAASGIRAASADLDGSSDYQPFIAAGIPAGGVLTGADETKTAGQAAAWGGRAGEPFDPCYHQACDRIDAVDRTALDRNADAVARAVGRFALSVDGLAN